MIKEFDSLYQLLETFPDETACVKHVEAIRWPRGIICPLCGSSRKVYHRNRPGVYKCADCVKEFSIRKNTIFEESPIPLRKWFIAIWLVSSHRKGIPSPQMAREIGVTQKTAWFVLGRLREVYGNMAGYGGPIDGEVEADETYIGGKEKNKHANKKLRAGRGPVGKAPVAGVRSRSGKVKARPVANSGKHEIQQFVRSNVVPGSTLYTDEHGAYVGLREYNQVAVNHSAGEFVRGIAHTNGIESFWALLKRGYVGTFHQFSMKHLHRYINEFESRWNFGKMNGGARLNALLGACAGVRLTYRELIA